MLTNRKEACVLFPAGAVFRGIYLDRGFLVRQIGAQKPGALEPPVLVDETQEQEIPAIGMASLKQTWPSCRSRLFSYLS